MNVKWSVGIKEVCIDEEMEKKRIYRRKKKNYSTAKFLLFLFGGLLGEGGEEREKMKERKGGQGKKKLVFQRRSAEFENSLFIQPPRRLNTQSGPPLFFLFANKTRIMS